MNNDNPDDKFNNLLANFIGIGWEFISKKNEEKMIIEKWERGEKDENKLN